MIGTYWEDLGQKIAELKEALAHDQRTPQWGHLQHLAQPDDESERVFSAAYSFTRIPEPAPARTGSPLRVRGFSEAKRTERRAKNKAARKARRQR